MPGEGEHKIIKLYWYKSTNTYAIRAPVILSGHEVPGEGEHKIMEYLRREKMQDGYLPNQVFKRKMIKKKKLFLIFNFLSSGYLGNRY